MRLERRLPLREKRIIGSLKRKCLTYARISQLHMNPPRLDQLFNDFNFFQQPQTCFHYEGMAITLLIAWKDGRSGPSIEYV